MSEWQDVKSIPKDGRWILCFIQTEIYEGFQIVYYHEVHDAFLTDIPCKYFEREILGWMPLPEKPKKKHSCEGWNKNFKTERHASGLIIKYMDQWTYIKFCPFCGYEAKND